MRAVLGRAHPRSRGENARANGPACPRRGSSPLTRGKLGGDKLVGVLSRLIPAHAGKTFRRKAGFSDWPAHPRSRGENAWTARGRSTGSGSSPLTRGKRGQGDDDAHTWRLIPAHAGKTLAHDTVNVLPQAHPRSRGENQEAACDVVGAVGSSPLTRGKLQGAKDSWLGNRLIPAHAGKTGAGSPPTSDRRAHPRSRGENDAQPRSDAKAGGSSPLTRGKRRAQHKKGPRRGLIPAHAGKTSRSPSRRPPTEAHPRSRGENSSPPWRRRTCTGSSPLTRGKRAE